MKLIVINSNSKGNSFALDAGSEILLIEAGCRLSDVNGLLNYRTDKVVGCLVTHRHGDHAKYVEQMSRRGITICANDDVVNSAKLQYGSYHVTKDNETVKFGGFSVTPFHTNHDVPSQGFLIYHKEMGTLYFATDTYKLDFAMSHVDNFLIEANYDDKVLRCNVEDGKIDRKQAGRLMTSHMSIDNTIKFLTECKAETARNIILCHLSERNSCPDDFVCRVKETFGTAVYYAHKGLTVELGGI